MTTLAIITHETIGERMTGPGIRAFEIARALGASMRVILASPRPVTRQAPGVEPREYSFQDRASIDRAAAGADVLLVQGFTLHKFPTLARTIRPIVVDLYCPFHLENLERRRLVEPKEGFRQHATAVEREVLAAQLTRGDFFLCASDRQRDYWLGMLTALGRVSPAVYEVDPTLRSLVAVLPFGIETAPPAPGPAVLRDRTPGIGRNDRVLLWGGSVTDWHDPLTPIRAVARLAGRVPSVRLVFPAGLPNPDLPPMRALAQAREEAAARGLLGRHVFFTDWVAYDRRGALLLEADIGVSAHLPSLEARYAWRTRLLDYIWAGLPVVCTEGDALANLVRHRGLGLTTAPGDEASMAAAMERLLTDTRLVDACRDRCAAERPRLEWRHVVEPLRAFCAAPARSPSSSVVRSSPAALGARLRHIGDLVRRRRR